MTIETGDVPTTTGGEPSDRIDDKPPVEAAAGLNLVDLSATAKALPSPDSSTAPAESTRPADVTAVVPVASMSGDGSVVFAADMFAANADTTAPPAQTYGDNANAAYKPASGDKPNVVKDEQGRVTEINYPDGTTRRLGYAEDGTINRVVDRDGTSYVLKEGKWEEDATAKRRRRSAPAGQVQPSHKNSDTTEAELPPPFVAVSVSDDGTFRYQTADGRDVQDLPDGTSQTVDSKTGYMVHKNQDGRVDFIITAAAQMVLIRRDENGKPDSITFNMMQTYHLENGKWVTADGQPAPVTDIEVWGDGTITYVDAATGDNVQKRADGTTIVRQGNGARIETNARGQVVETDYNDLRTKRTFTYDDQGNLTAITDGDGNKIEKDEDGDWRDKDGNEICDVKVERDGTIHYVNDDDKLVTLNTDGTTTTTSVDADDIDDLAHLIGVAGDMPPPFNYQHLERIKDEMEDMTPEDRVALQKAYEARYGRSLTDDLRENFDEDDVADIVKDLESAKLLEDARQRMTADEYRQFVRDLNEFMQRAKRDGLSDQEIGDTLKAFDQLLTAPHAKLDADQRKMLALQMMGFAANPSSIDQGNHSTCAPNDVEIITWTRNPAAAAQMVTQVAIEGKYTSTDGHEVAIPPENLVPQPGSEGRHNTSERLFASQLFQAAVLCDIGSRRNPPEYYRQGKPSIDNPTGEYWIDANGNEIEEFDGLNAYDTMDALMRLNDDDGKFFMYSDSWGTRHIITYESEEELREELKEAKENGQFPIIIMVCSDDPLFSASAKPGDAKKRNHVVVIDDYNPETGQVHIDNTWGDEKDKWVDVKTLYDATVPYTPPPKEEPANQQAA